MSVHFSQNLPEIVHIDSRDDYQDEIDEAKSQSDQQKALKRMTSRLSDFHLKAMNGNWRENFYREERAERLNLFRIFNKVTTEGFG